MNIQQQDTTIGSGDHPDVASLRDVFYVLSRRKWMILVFASAVMVVVGYSVKSASRVYVSSAKLVLIPTKTNPLNSWGLDVTGVESELLQSREFAQAVVKQVTPAEILKSPPGKSGEPAFTTFANKLVRKLGLPFPTTGKPSANREAIGDAAVTKFENSFDVKGALATLVIGLSYSAYYPQDAQRILNSTIAVYLQKHTELSAASTSLKTLSGQTEQLRARLTTAQRALSEFQSTLDVPQFDEQQRLLVEQVNNLKAEIQTTEADHSEAEAAATAASQKLGLRQFEQEQRVRADSLEAKLSVLKGQLRSAQNALADSAKTQQKLETLNQEVKSASDQYGKYYSALEQARIALSLQNREAPDVAVLQSATYPLKPKSNRLMLAAGIMVATVGSIGLAFLLELLNHTVRTSKDVTVRLGLNNLAWLPPIGKRTVRTRLRRELRMRTKRPGSHVRLPPGLSEHVITWQYLIPKVRDSFEELRNRIELITRNDVKRPYVLAITSCYRGEGVSTIAAGLAYFVAFAEGEPVLLMNTTRHHADRDIVPGEFRPPGLFEVDVQRRMIDPRQNGLQLLEGDGMNEYVARMDSTKAFDTILPSAERLDYKYLVLDLPALGEGSAGAIHAARADGTLIVIESERVRREVVQTTVQRLEQSGARILGVVLNKRKLYVPKWLYRIS